MGMGERNESGDRVFPHVNRIDGPKAVTYIPILLGHYRQILELRF